MTHTILKYEPEPQHGLKGGSEFLADCFSELSHDDYLLAKQFDPDDFIWVTTESGKSGAGAIVKLSKKDALALAKWITETFN
jgi:thiamine monophosphate kinase